MLDKTILCLKFIIKFSHGQKIYSSIKMIQFQDQKEKTLSYKISKNYKKKNLNLVQKLKNCNLLKVLYILLQV